MIDGPRLRRRKGADHILISSRIICGQHELDFLGERNQEIKHHLLWVATGKFGWRCPFSARKKYPMNHTMNVPPPSSVYNLTKFIPREERTYLSSYIGSAIYPLWRKNISAQCEDRPDKCLRGGSTRHDAHVDDYGSIYTNCIFAFTPGGDDTMRKGLWDALAAGAIPVIFEELTLDAHFPELFSHPREFSVFLNTTHDMISQLENIPNEKIDAMLRKIWEMRLKFQYIPGEREDAFFHFVKKLEAYANNGYQLPSHPWEQKIKCVQPPDFSNIDRNLNEPSENCRFQ